MILAKLLHYLKSDAVCPSRRRSHSEEKLLEVDSEFNRKRKEKVS